MAVNIKKPAAIGRVNVAASAELMKGAVHGVATAVASTPFKKDPIKEVGRRELPAIR
jgi:hypothetical protein